MSRLSFKPNSAASRPARPAGGPAGRSVLDLRFVLAPLFASAFIGLGIGLACTPDAGVGCSAGTTNCECAPGNVCYPGLVCVAGFCLMGNGDGETGNETNDGDADAGDGDGDNGCDNGQEFCGGKCVDPQTHPLHCGGCDMPCTSEEQCHEGSCATDCSELPCEGLTWCDPDTSLCLPGCSDDFQCGANEICDLSTHECICAFGYQLCGDECIFEGDPCEDNCGNGSIDVGETCDGNALGGYTCEDFGFNGGTLECLSDCSDFDTSSCSDDTCGNGVVDIGEQCDGVNLDGFDCVDLGFAGGTLSCTNCMFNTNNCNDAPDDDGNCCIAHMGVGCEVPAIQQCVCGMDAYCCNTEWDDICTGIAIDNCNANCP
jgi:hypothetical protein